MDKLENLASILSQNKNTWLVTGVAGFIGSNLLEFLLNANQIVVGLDNLSTGSIKNILDVKSSVSEARWDNFRFINGDIADINSCTEACKGVDYVLHQAALGSVPRSIKDPAATNRANIDGFLNILVASKDSAVKKFVYASSSAVYGDSPNLPKIESDIGKPLSPYAVTKYVNELYAEVFFREFGLPTIGLRYFNVFGKRQDPLGEYSAVIPRWIKAVLSEEQVLINGDGKTGRDFSYIDNVMQANILAAISTNNLCNGQSFNIAVGQRTSLTELYTMIANKLSSINPNLKIFPAKYQEFRRGDIRDSLANTEKAENYFNYQPEINISNGLDKTLPWYIKNI